MGYNFNFSHDTLIEYVGTIIGYLKDDLPAFTAFDPELNEAKKDRMLELMEWSLAEGGDENVLASLAELTEKATEEFAHCRDFYHQLRYWIIKSFPENKAIQRKFGIGRFGKLRESQSRMVLFMGALVNYVEEHREALEASGAPTDLLNQTSVRSEALRATNELQEVKKNNRMVNTSRRVALLNELFQHAKDFNKASEFVFFDQTAKRETYRPPRQKPQPQSFKLQVSSFK